MRAILRENLLCAVAALAGSATLAWLGLYGFAWNDYEIEAQPAVQQLLAGHLLGFLRDAPSYGGSLIERAPFALAPALWGGGELAVYRMLALPCLLAAAALGIVLVARARRRGAAALGRGVALALCVANPLALIALELGHSEELLGASLCVGAVLLAGTRGHSRTGALLAGLALGLAVANKESAVLAAGPLIAVLPRERRALAAATAVLSAGAVLAPLLLGSRGFVASTQGIASTSSAIFQPWQVWWFLGHHGAAIHGLFGAPKPGYRHGPAWTATLSHPLIVLVGAALGGSLLLRSRGRERAGRAPLALGEALLACALLMLLRCLLDTWDTAYYPLPFLFCLLAWELEDSPARPPLLSLAASALCWASFHWMPLHVSADTEAALFLAWTVPLACWLAWRLADRRAGTLARGLPEPRALAQEITVSALGSAVRTS